MRAGNRAIEQSAWGGYRTEFYPTYDYNAVAEERRHKNE
jgi:hypothetical protein